MGNKKNHIAHKSISELKALFNKIERNNYAEREVFTDVIALSACMLHQSAYNQILPIPKGEAYEEVENVRKEVVRKFNAKELSVIHEDILPYLEREIQNGYQDILGNYYMELGANKNTAQFFTPYEISYLMAKMTFTDEHRKIIKCRGYINLSEPCVGAGGMILAFARVMQEDGFNPLNQLCVDAIDIEMNAFYIAYLQLSLAGLSGTVSHGDTLRMEFWRTWETPISKIQRCFRVGKYANCKAEETKMTDDIAILKQDNIAIGEQFMLL